MPITKTEISRVIRMLKEACEDNLKGYENALCDLKSNKIKSIFSNYVSQRTGFKDKLEEILKTFKDDSQEAEDGNELSLVIKGWYDVNCIKNPESDIEILNMCEKGEDILIDEFEEAMSSPLPADVAQIIEGQFNQVKEGHNNIKTLRNIKE